MEKLNLQPTDLMAVIAAVCDGISTHIKTPSQTGYDPEGVLRELGRAFQFAERLKDIANDERAKAKPDESVHSNGAETH